MSSRILLDKAGVFPGSSAYQIFDVKLTLRSVGKSSVINTLRSKAVAKVAPIPGETKYVNAVRFNLISVVRLTRRQGVAHDLKIVLADQGISGAIRQGDVTDEGIERL